MINQLVLKNRSYRRFDASCSIDYADLEELVGLARVCPSSRNQQALKFLIVNEKGMNSRVYQTLAWAGYLKDWDGPVTDERPTGYILCMGDTRLGNKFDIDLGIVTQTMLLGATEKGFGGCIIASVKRDELRQLLGIPDYLEILVVLALGKPVEEVVIAPVIDGNIKYWRNEQGTHYVPKRDLAELLIRPEPVE